ATGKENKIKIQASSGLNEEEIARMVKDAEANAEDDKKKIELVQAKNQADTLIHSMKKALTEHGDKVADEKPKIEEAIKELEEAIKGDDKELIEAKTTTLMTVSQKLGEKMYADAQAQQAGAETAAAGAAGGAHESAKADDANVVDAEFTEVKDKK
ncbi:MAG: chaperone protein DnaK, partial [Betaproteobacteria bacterium]|nr:chaperone protein DnaK [Betaproteobacteria bacterium]